MLISSWISCGSESSKRGICFARKKSQSRWSDFRLEQNRNSERKNWDSTSSVSIEWRSMMLIDKWDRCLFTWTGKSSTGSFSNEIFLLKVKLVSFCSTGSKISRNWDQSLVGKRISCRLSSGSSQRISSWRLEYATNWRSLLQVHPNASRWPLYLFTIN